jgi:hypothetical protein
MKCFICKPVTCSTEGADHTGRDFFLRCRRCRTRTTHHVEGERLSPAIEAMLKREWRAGRIETPKRPFHLHEPQSPTEQNQGEG